MQKTEEPEVQIFRVHMSSQQVDIVAITAAEARQVARSRYPGTIISKVKVLKEDANG